MVAEVSEVVRIAPAAGVSVAVPGEAVALAVAPEDLVVRVLDRVAVVVPPAWAVAVAVAAASEEEAAAAAVVAAAAVDADVNLRR